jgi:hypothetical protein
MINIVIIAFTGQARHMLLTQLKVTVAVQKVLTRSDIARIARNTCTEAEKLRDWEPGKCFYRRGFVDGNEVAVGLEWRAKEGYFMAIGLVDEIIPEV